MTVSSVRTAVAWSSLPSDGVPPSHEVLYWPGKTLSEVLDFSLDISAPMGDVEDAPVQIVCTAFPDQGLSLSNLTYVGPSSNAPGQVATLLLSGGAVGVNYVEFEVTTAAGRVFEFSVVVETQDFGLPAPGFITNTVSLVVGAGIGDFSIGDSAIS